MAPSRIPGLLLLIPALAFLGGCSSSRLEHYSAPQNAPDLRQSPLLSVQVLHHKQTQRDLTTLVRLTNRTRLPVRWTRTGPQPALFTVTVLGVEHEALPPRAVTWSVFEPGVKRGAEFGERTIAPGEYADLELRFEFPSAIGDYEYPWDLRLSGLKLDVADLPVINVHWPPPEPPPARTKPYSYQASWD